MTRFAFLIFTVCLITFSLEINGQNAYQNPMTDTCDPVHTDTAANVHSIPMIMVGKAHSLPDSVSVHLLMSVAESLHCDTTGNFFGENNELIDFFVRNIVYPHQLKDLNMEDDLHLLMKIDKNGVLTESEVLNSEIPEMKQEVLRVSKLLPALLLTDKTGRRINSTIHLPISFRILKL